MAAYVKYNDFIEQVFKAIHDLDGTHVIKCALSNTAINQTHTLLSEVTEITAGAGYTAGGTATTPTLSESPAGTAKLVLTDVVFTSTGAFNTFQYVIVYNDSATSPLDGLIASYDHGSAVNLANTETFTVDFDASNGFFTAT